MNENFEGCNYQASKCKLHFRQPKGERRKFTQENAITARLFSLSEEKKRTKKEKKENKKEKGTKKDEKKVNRMKEKRFPTIFVKKESKSILFLLFSFFSRFFKEGKEWKAL